MKICEFNALKIEVLDFLNEFCFEILKRVLIKFIESVIPLWSLSPSYQCSKSNSVTCGCLYFEVLHLKEIKKTFFKSTLFFYWLFLDLCKTTDNFVCI